MKKRIQKILVILTVSLVFFFSLNKVYAQTTGIDLISLAANKVLSIVNLSTTSANTEIENERKKVETDTLNYVDDYIKGLDSELQAYAQQQKQEAKDKLGQNYKDIKSQLDAARQGLIDNAKQQVKQAIDSTYASEQAILTDNLNKKISEKFK